MKKCQKEISIKSNPTGNTGRRRFGDKEASGRPVQLRTLSVKKSSGEFPKSKKKSKKRKPFTIFRDECLRLQKKWGLINWRLDFIEGGTCADNEEAQAEVIRNINAYVARVYYYADKNDGNPKNSARHEMLHVLLGRLVLLGKNRFVTDTEIYSAEEEVVVTLEKLL